MKLTVLGSGCWEGVPAPFCKCKICGYASKNYNSKEFRTRPSFLFELDATSFIVDISPDIRIQASKHINNKISDFLVSHAHFDHFGGIGELDAYSELVLENKAKIYGPKQVGEYIDKHFSYMNLDFVGLHSGVDIEFGSINVTPIEVKHIFHQEPKLPENSTFGYVIRTKKSKVVYLADFYEIPESSLELAKDADLIIADGTYLFEEIYPVKPYQNKIVQEIDHDHLHGRDIFKYVEKFNAKKIVFHSISHLPELMHDEIQNNLPMNMLAAYDGMNFEFE